MMKALKLLLLLVLTLGLAGAQPSQIQAVKLQPSFFDFHLQPGEEVTRWLTITNTERVALSFVLESSELRFTREGTPQFLGNDDLAPDSLLWWVAFETGPYTLEPGASQEIPIKIKVPQEVVSGGHYGAVLIKNLPTNQKVEAGSQIALQSKVASLLFIDVVGSSQRSFKILSFSADQTLYSRPPTVFNLYLENTGTTHLQPHGVITLTNTITKKKANDLIVNEGFAYLFPGVAKNVQLTWDGQPDWGLEKMVGRYTAVLDLTTEGVQPQRLEVTFWIIPPTIWLLLGLIVINLIVAGYRFRKLIFKGRRFKFKRHA